MSQNGTVIYDLQYSKPNVTFGTVVINHITNPFDPINSKRSKTDLHGSTLDTYLPGFCLGQKYAVRVNSEVLPLESDYSTYVVKAGDVITFAPVVAGGGGGGGGKNIIAMVAMIAIIAIAPMAAAGFMSMTAGAVSAGLYGGLSGALIYGGLQMAFIVAGSLLINSILTPSTPTAGNLVSPELESSTYSWTGIQTSRDLNKPIPVLYGTHALGGTVINNRFTYNGNDDWISMQIALCHGEIETITEDNMKINDSTYSSFITSSENTINYDYRVGTFDQSIMTGFSDSIYNNGAVTRKIIYNEPYNFESTSTNMDMFRLHFEFPKGCYLMDSSSGAKSAKTVQASVKYRVKGSADWSDMYFYGPIYGKEYLHEYWYEARDGGDGSGSERILFWSRSASPVYVASSSYSYTYTSVVSSRTIVIDYGYITTLEFKLNTTTSFKKYVEPVDSNGYPITLSSNAYEFQVTRLTPESPDNSPYDVSDLYVRFLEEIQTADVNYGGVALLGLNVKATDQLSNNRPNVTTVVTRKALPLNGVYRDSANPAWICLDILTNKHYGMGLDFSKINLVEFERWAEFCDGGVGEYLEVHNIIPTSSDINVRGWDLIIPASEVPEGESLTLSNLNLNTSSITVPDVNNGAMNISNIEKIEAKYIVNDYSLDDGLYYFVTFNRLVNPTGYIEYTLYSKTGNFTTTPKLQFNGLFDTTSDVWNTLQEVAKVGRGQVILIGTKYSAIFDEPKIVTGLYNGSNSKNVVVKYIGRADIASEIELQFTDKNIGYEMTSISVQDSDAMNSGVQSKKTTMQLKGITSEEEALVMGRYLLATSKYLRRTLTFDADIEAITQTVGDVIAVQTDVTQYGVGGLIASRLGNIVTLDNVVALEKGKTYTLKIKNHQTDVVKDYVFVADDVEPNTAFSFDSILNTSVGSLKFDDFELIIQFQDESYIETSILIVPQGYEINVSDRYAFGLAGSDSIICTITDISREGDLTRKISAIEYNPSILDFDYDNDILQRIDVTKRRANVISNITASDRLVKTSVNETVAMLSMSWDATVSSFYNIYVLDNGFKHYLGSNIKGTRFEYPATDLQIETEYDIFVEDVYDNSVYSSIKHTITAFSAVPEAIDDFTITSTSSSLLFKVTYSNKPLDFAHYVLKINGVVTSKSISDEFSVPFSANINDNTYEVYAVDTIGKEGEALIKQFTVSPATIAAVNYSIVNDSVVVDFTATPGTFSISKYLVAFDTHVIERTTPTITIRADWSGNKVFNIYAEDSVGNISQAYTISIPVIVPTVRNIKAVLDNADVVVSWDTPNSPLSIEYYKVSYDGVELQVKSNSVRIPVTWGGAELFSVIAVTTYGIESQAVNVAVEIQNPSLENLQAEVIDNNVLLRWTGIKKSLPINTYNVYKSVNGVPVFIGAKTGSFTTIFESEAGAYTYYVSAVDTGGNEGELVPVVTQVSEPPDYVLNVNWTSTFTGTKTNTLVSGNVLYLPVNTTETISEHFDNNMWLSAQDQVDAGYNLWIEPFEGTGSYEEVFDYGTVLASSLVTLNLAYTTLYGTPNVVTLVSLSQDGITYIDYPGQDRVYGSAFRYVKINISVTGPDAAIGISNLDVKLDSKAKADSGLGNAVSTDVNGTPVLFNKTFIDITAITVTPQGTSPVIAIYDFEDVPNPVGFTVYMYDTNGVRVNGAFSWSVRGY